MDGNLIEKREMVCAYHRHAAEQIALINEDGFDPHLFKGVQLLAHLRF